MGNNKKKKKNKMTASGEDTTSSQPTVPSRQGTTCPASSGSSDRTAQALDGPSSLGMETGQTRSGTKFSAGDGNDAHTTTAAAHIISRYVVAM